MTMWWAAPWVGFDTETTGLNVDTDRIVTAAIGTVEPAEGAGASWSTVINPGVEVPAAAADIHGWTTERVQAEGGDPAAELTRIVDMLTDAVTTGHALVVMNAAYDLTILDRECRRHGIKTLHRRLDGQPLHVLDPMVIDRRIDKYRPGKRTLADLCATYQVRTDGPHDAGHDVRATLRVLWRIGRMAAATGHPQLVDRFAAAGRRKPHDLARAYRALADLTVEQIHEKQVGWYAEQTADFGAYLARELDKAVAVLVAAGEGTPEDEQTVTDLRAKLSGLSTYWPIRPT